jgi:hypothetical protein
MMNWSNLRYCYKICLEGQRNTRKILSVRFQKSFYENSLVVGLFSRYCNRHSETSFLYKREGRVLVGKSQGKRPFNHLDLREVDCEYMNWICLFQDWTGWKAFRIAAVKFRLQISMKFFDHQLFVR